MMHFFIAVSTVSFILGKELLTQDKVINQHVLLDDERSRSN